MRAQRAPALETAHLKALLALLARSIEREQPREEPPVIFCARPASHISCTCALVVKRDFVEQRRVVETGPVP